MYLIDWLFNRLGDEFLGNRRDYKQVIKIYSEGNKEAGR